MNREKHFLLRSKTKQEFFDIITKNNNVTYIRF